MDIWSKTSHPDQISPTHPAERSDLISPSTQQYTQIISHNLASCTPRSYNTSWVDPTIYSSVHPNLTTPSTQLDSQIISHHLPSCTPKSYRTTYPAVNTDHISPPILLDTIS
ncbi:hypothetical protein CHS0354_014556 [Potamilus streckersoni]|uniref:Uncharacterized protein n=1 Tax=Potamilus streckersoni TaxID=2493646 RepID=A0AAE0RQJ5_9BIVA|nr:hypothetical protein CHS0354_014556 [Potamilus streckersoni]